MGSGTLIDAIPKTLVTTAWLTFLLLGCHRGHRRVITLTVSSNSGSLSERYVPLKRLLRYCLRDIAFQVACGSVYFQNLDTFTKTLVP